MKGVNGTKVNGVGEEREEDEDVCDEMTIDEIINGKVCLRIIMMSYLVSMTGSSLLDTHFAFLPSRQRPSRV